MGCRLSKSYSPDSAPAAEPSLSRPMIRTKPGAGASDGWRWTRSAAAVFAKEARTEWRTRQAAGTTLLFSVTTLTALAYLLASKSVGSDVKAALLWIVLLFSAMSGARARLRPRGRSGHGGRPAADGSGLRRLRRQARVQRVFAPVDRGRDNAAVFRRPFRECPACCLRTAHRCTLIRRIGFGIGVDIRRRVGGAGTWRRSPRIPVFSWSRSRPLVPALLAATTGTLAALAPNAVPATAGPNSPCGIGLV